MGGAKLGGKRGEGIDIRKKNNVGQGNERVPDKLPRNASRKKKGRNLFLKAQ